MASKLAQEASTEDIAELLDTVDKTLDRLKTLYEQYFLGIQKQAPAYIHSDVERKLRDLTQLQIRNTGLRYRFATISQKFGSYNAYWRRTLRQIENGTYARNLHKIGRDAVRTGAEIPEEILAAMPKRMRDQVIRDREQALAIAARRRPGVEEGDVDVNLDLDDMPPEATEDLIAMIKEPTAVRRDLKTRSGAHIVDSSDSDLDIDAFFAEIEAEPEPEPAEPDHDDAHSTQKRAPVRVESPPVARPTTGQPMSAAVDPNVRRTGPQQAVDASGRPIDPNARRSGVQPVARPATDPSPTAAAPPTPAPVRPQVPAPARPGVPAPARPGARMPSQATKPNPITPGAAAAQGAVPVESMSGPFPRTPVQPPSANVPKPPTGAIPRPMVATPSGGMPAIPRPAVMTPTGGMPAIPKPVSSGNSGPTPIPGNSGPTPIPTTNTGPSSMPRAASPPPARAASSPHTVPRAATAPGGATAPVRPAEPVRPQRADTQPGTPTDMEEPPAIVTQTRPTVRAQSPRPGTAPARATTQPKPAPSAPQRPPPGMTDADVNALYAKYVKAKEMVGEKIGPGEHHKLLKTINAQAPKIMQQYNAKAVDFSVVVKDNQVIIRAKPKT